MNDELFQDLLKVEGINFRGYGIIPKFIMFDIELTLEAKAIYAYFCSYTGRGNTAFPGRDKILFDLGINKNTYYHHFNLLLAQGYITVATQIVNGLKSRNIYTLVSTPQKFKDYQSDPKKEEKYSVIRCSGLKSLGYGMIPKAVMQDERLSIKSKGIYAFFSSLTGSGNTAFPLISDITYFLNITKPTFYKHYRPLLDFNYVTAVQRHIDGVLSSNEYTLNEMPVVLPNTEDKPKRHIKVIKTFSAARSGQQLQKTNPIPDQCTKKWDTASDQCTKKQDTVKQDTVKWDTKINNLDNQQSTKSINQSIFKSAENEGMKKSVPDSTNEEISSDYSNNRAQIEDTVHKATNYGQVCENYSEQNQYTHAVFCLFNDALIDMLNSEQIMYLNRQKVSSEMVNDKFFQCLGNAHNLFDTKALIELASSDYIKGCQWNSARGTDVKSPLNYMKSCIWNAMLVGKIGLLNPDQVNNSNASQQSQPYYQPKNRFCNFTPRDIDFAALEKMELELLKESVGAELLESDDM